MSWVSGSDVVLGFDFGSKRECLPLGEGVVKVAADMNLSCEPSAKSGDARPIPEIIQSSQSWSDFEKIL